MCHHQCGQTLVDTKYGIYTIPIFLHDLSVWCEDIVICQTRITVTCNVIKQNESKLPNVDFQIQPNKSKNLFVLMLFG